MGDIHQFLLVFDHRQGRLVSERDFGLDDRAALLAYETEERAARGADHIEVVLVGSDSIDTVRITHANYFDVPVGSSRFLAGI